MAIAVVSSVVAQTDNATDVTTAAIDTTGANLLLLGLSDLSLAEDSITISDSKSNTWTILNEYSSGSNVAQATIFYSVNPTVGSGHTFTAESFIATLFPTIAVLAVSGANISTPFDQQNGNSSASASSLSTNSVTPGENNEIIFTICNAGGIGGGPTSINSGFTLQESAVGTATAYSIAIAHLIQTAAAAVNPTWTITGGAVDVAAAIATFKAAASAVTIRRRRLLLGVGR